VLRNPEMISRSPPVAGRVSSYELIGPRMWGSPVFASVTLEWKTVEP
jgi:hypothetical protein